VWSAPDVQRAGLGDAGKQGDQRDGEDVFDDQDAEDQLREPLLHQPQLRQGLGDDRGRGDGEDGAQEQAVHPPPAEGAAQAVPDQQHQKDLEPRGDEGRHADGGEVAQAEVEAEAEHQQDDAQLRHDVDRVPVEDRQRERRVRPDKNAREDVPQHDGLAELVAEHRDQAGHDHHHRQILQKIAVHRRRTPREQPVKRAVRKFIGTPAARLTY